MSEKRLPILNDLAIAVPASPIGQLWVRSGDEPRGFYTDDDGKDYDIVDMRDALLAIQANTAPTAVSLSLENRIAAIYAIACQALPE